MEKKYNPSKISELSRWLVMSIQNKTSGLLLVFLGWTSSTLFFLHLANRFLIDCTIPAIFQPDSKVTGEEIVIVENPSFLANFSQLIKDTPKRVQVLDSTMIEWLKSLANENITDPPR